MAENPGPCTGAIGLSAAGDGISSRIDIAMSEEEKRPTAEIDTVVFDIGNVLLRWDPAFLYEKLIPDAQERAFFLREVVPLDWHLEHDRGRSYGETIPERQRRFPRYAELIAAYYERWDETIAGPIWGSVALLEALHARGVPLYAITNYSAETFPRARQQFPFLGRFRDIVVSGEEGVVKPDPVIFTRAIARFGIRPETALFIDDSPANVEAAAECGFRTHRFVTPQDLCAVLARANLVPADFDLDAAAARMRRRYAPDAGRREEAAVVREA
ncbi:MAG: HAD family phosphatase [Alphaproteobacteria bacterium]|nr:MAG: HAD family phosphatase [Alphaproteobacteria bacterium]